MSNYAWTTTVEIEAESQEDSYIKLMDMDTYDFPWDIELIEEKDNE